MCSIDSRDRGGCRGPGPGWLQCKVGVQRHCNGLLPRDLHGKGTHKVDISQEFLQQQLNDGHNAGWKIIQPKN